MDNALAMIGDAPEEADGISEVSNEVNHQIQSAPSLSKLKS